MVEVAIENKENSEEDIVEERKRKILSIIKTNSDWISYIILILLIILAVHIRTGPMEINPNTGNPGLWDITTNSWTLGPDLDPFLFLRWAEYIDAHGSLFDNDEMRYVPLGFDVRGELILHPYMMAWFHKIASVFGSTSVTQSAVIYPVVFFALTVIIFFFMTREMFIDSLKKRTANVIALISSFFLIVLPPLLPRTIAGIPEKESAGFFFIFLAFFLFLKAWKAKKLQNALLFSFLTALFKETFRFKRKW